MTNTEYTAIDDVWGTTDDDEDQTTYDRRLAEKEWEKIQEDHGNIGYKEGIVEGKEVNMQRGFDTGYLEGFSIGKEIGRLRGLVSCQVLFYEQMVKHEEAVKELKALFDEIDKVGVQHIFSVEYFRDNGIEDNENYVAPKTFVQNLEEKVLSTLKDIQSRYL
ncbi:hypothetical protein BDF20DRAFT_838251 [Mycotypha africana]|uniref:uncharacterized protein n=1 Tax=Mycotypha africana TaxID=64632 RepID=UPI002300D4E5|nr:uncharacterized protein BDF20DRAFT_838251 [Mycotypha africana]KAI8971985.1 hypothetical protein BDF20DRAFT_838251 [Mycotypha africana]